MKGLLKAFIVGQEFQFDKSRPNTPDRYGVTLAYVDLVDPSQVADFDYILKNIVGLDVAVQISGRLIASKTTALKTAIKWPKAIAEEFGLFNATSASEALLKGFYEYSHHITEGWDNGEAPIVAAKDMTAYTKAVQSDYWDMVEADSLGFLDSSCREGQKFLTTQGWSYQELSATLTARIEWKDLEGAK